MSFPKTPALMTDCAVFDPEGRVLLVRRGSEPYKGCYALPGGFVEVGETVEAACRRETHEEAGVFVGENLQLVGVYSDPHRDPRGHSVSVAYATVLERPAEPQAGSDAQSAEWIEKWWDEILAFNHAQILGDAVRFIGGHGGFSRKVITARPFPDLPRSGSLLHRFWTLSAEQNSCSFSS